MHTPGPWTATNRMSSGEVWIHSKDGHVAVIKSAIGTNRSLNEESADARLIAAAPDLLAALMVVAKDPKISAWLAQNDPKALAQVTAATFAAGAPGQCGLCARMGTNDHSGPQAHSPGCLNDSKP